MEKNGMRNVVLITVDCLRYDHLKYMKKILSIPHISFRNVFSNATFTGLSVPSFMTSKYPPVNRPHKTIAHILRDEGYSTGAFIPNVMMLHPKVKKIGIHKAFDRFEVYLRDDPAGLVVRGIDRSMTEIIDIISLFLERFQMKNIGDVICKAIGYYPFTVWINEQNAERLIKDAINWKKSIDEPYFLWLHLMDVHEPYMPPDGYRCIDKKSMYIVNRRLRYARFWLSQDDIKKLHSLYIDEINYVDNILYSFINKLIHNGDIVILTADHGEQFGEHGGIAHFNWNMHDEQIHVPFVIFGIKRKANTDKISSLVDLAPTILDLLGIEHDNLGMVGKTIFDVKDTQVFIAGGNSILRGGWRNYRNLYGIRTRKWKLFKDRDTWRLYNLYEDPQEKNNLFYKEGYEDEKQMLFYMLDRYKKIKDTYNL